MWLMQKIMFVTLLTLVYARNEKYGGQGRHQRTQARGEESSEENDNDNDNNVGYYFKKNLTHLTSTTPKPKQDAIIEKFIESLITSEKYFKKVENMERRIRILEISFGEKTSAIIKYLLEILQLVKNPPPLQMEKLRATEPKQALYPKTREGHQYHASDSTLDTRMSVMEDNIKSIVAGVESILSTIAEVKNRQHSRTFVKSEGATPAAADPLNLINEFRRTLHQQKYKKCDCKDRFDRAERYPTDCHEIQMQGFNASGIYKIKPEDIDPFYVLCDLTTAGGGWTVFQNRFDGSQDFYKGWSDYKNGFGNLASEFWLGLEKLSYLTNQKLYELRIEMETQHGQEAYAGYSVFTVGPEHEGYRISTLGTYYGTAGDSMAYHAGQKFSTLDMDNDEWKDGACATEHGGAWWYKECDKSNLNGRYTPTSEEHRGQSIYWISFKGPNSPLSKTKMMIRPLPASKPVYHTDNFKRKILDNNKLKAHRASVKARPTDLKGTYEPGRAPYRYEDPAPAEVFFPNYA